jgi:hypothetical protein
MRPTVGGAGPCGYRVSPLGLILSPAGAGGRSVVILSGEFEAAGRVLGQVLLVAVLPGLPGRSGRVRDEREAGLVGVDGHVQRGVECRGQSAEKREGGGGCRRLRCGRCRPLSGRPGARGTPGRGRGPFGGRRRLVPARWRLRPRRMRGRHGVLRGQSTRCGSPRSRLLLEGPVVVTGSGGVRSLAFLLHAERPASPSPRVRSRCRSGDPPLSA